MVRSCEFSRYVLSTTDHRVMNTHDPRLHGPSAQVAALIDDSRRWPSPSLLTDAIRGVVGGLLAAAGRWLRDLGSATQLGPDPEQVTGRETGLRT
jgi:hypothetical protein